MTAPFRPRLSHLAIIALIAIFDLYVLVLVLRPNVADDYRAYYIDRTTSCFPRLISGYYPLGEPVSFIAGRPGYDRDSIRWCGFMPANNQGIRSFGDYGILRLRFADPKQDLLLTFTSYANVFENTAPRDVAVLVNDTRLETLHFTGQQRVLGKIVVPAAVVAKGKGGVEIKFEVPRTGPPGTNGEPLTLTFRLTALRLAPVTLAPDMPPIGDAAPTAVTPRLDAAGAAVLPSTPARRKKGGEPSPRP
jgi:hypothetical protein